jgi:hypothetical protein
LTGTIRTVRARAIEHGTLVDDRNDTGTERTVLVHAFLATVARKKFMTDALDVRSAELRRSGAGLGTVSPVHVANGVDLEQGKLQGGLEQARVGVVVVIEASTV